MLADGCNLKSVQPFQKQTDGVGWKIDDVRIERMDRIIICKLPQETEFYTIFAKIPFFYGKACCIKRLPLRRRASLYMSSLFSSHKTREREKVVKLLFGI